MVVGVLAVVLDPSGRMVMLGTGIMMIDSRVSLLLLAVDGAVGLGVASTSGGCCVVLGVGEAVPVVRASKKWCSGFSKGWLRWERVSRLAVSGFKSFGGRKSLGKMLPREKGGGDKGVLKSGELSSGWWLRISTGAAAANLLAPAKMRTNIRRGYIVRLVRVLRLKGPIKFKHVVLFLPQSKPRFLSKLRTPNIPSPSGLTRHNWCCSWMEYRVTHGGKDGSL